MSTKGTKRKTAIEFTAEHELFLVLVAEKRPELEIMQALGLSKTQLKDHTLKALQEGEITAVELTPSYEVVSVNSLPAVIRKRLPRKADDDTETLVKVEVQDSVVLLTLLPAVPQGLAKETALLDTDGEETSA